MCKLSPALFAVLLLGGAGSAPAADEPRALVERAVKAMGGLEALQQRVAVRMKVKGAVHFDGAPLKDIPIEGDLSEFGHQARLAFRIDLLGSRREAIVVMNGEKSWRSIDGQVQELSKEEIESLKTAIHQDRVTGLVAVLTDKGFTFAPLDEIQVHGRPARGVKVSYKGQPDTSLYFDRETGLLVKYAYRAKKTGDEKEALHETILSDYREPDLALADEQILRAAKLDVSGPALLAFVRKQTPSPADLERARTLIRKLGDDSFKVREKATADLIALGAVAVPLLREAVKDPDREVVRRARQCLQQIGEQNNKALVSAAVRLLGLRRPAGTAAVLLNYLPGADADVAREVRASLFAVAGAGGKPDAALVQALDDKDPVRRAAAAAALGKDGGAYAKQPGRRLFGRMPRHAMKNTTWVDGKLRMELETFDHQFFNQFDEKEFAKP